MSGSLVCGHRQRSTETCWWWRLAALILAIFCETVSCVCCRLTEVRDYALARYEELSMQ